MELGVLEVWVNAITLHTPLALGLPGGSVLEPGELSDESLAEPEPRNILASTNEHLLVKAGLLVVSLL